MKKYFNLNALCLGALIGALAGAAAGFLSQYSPVWIKFSLWAATKAGAIGWLAGIALSPLLAGLSLRSARLGKIFSALARIKILRGSLLVLALAPLVLWFLPTGPKRNAYPPPASPPPNIILISIDALRADYLGSYGRTAGLTPHLNAFAREASKYDSAYAASSWTLPSFGALFSGLPPSQCGLKTPRKEKHDWYVWSARIDDRLPLLAEALQQQGYATGAELANPFFRPARGIHRGFDFYRNEGAKYEPGEQLTLAQNLTQNARAWLRQKPASPIFLWVHYLDPHVPYNLPDTAAPERKKYPKDWTGRRKEWYDEISRQPESDQAQFQDFAKYMYAREVAYVDKWVGLLLAEIKRAGLYDNSLIIITADHGEELFDHGQFEHGHALHEEVLRVPLLIKWPAGTSADKEINQVVSLVDLGGTILAQAGGSGRPALPMRNADRGAEVYSEALLHVAEQTALTTDKYKIIYYPFAAPGEKEFEVYDRKRDRTEQHDLANTDAAEAERARLKALTQKADIASEQWQQSGDEAFRRIKLTDKDKARLKSLGYLGD